MPFAFAWAAFTLAAAAFQTVRNALQRHLTPPLGAIGATQVRFLFALPFSLLFVTALLALGEHPPAPNIAWVLWACEGAATQMVATGLMLAAMRHKSFSITIAYTKTEPVQVALWGLLALGDPLTPTSALAIAAATAGVMIASWPKRSAAASSPGAIALGLVSGGFFALSSIGFRAAILSLGPGSFVMHASATLVFGLALQSIASLLWILIRARRALAAMAARWRPCLAAGATGAVASQFWFLAFALATAADVRTLGVAEVLFAQIVSRKFLNEGVSRRELCGLALIAVGIVLIVAR